MASDPAHKQFVIRRASTPADYVAFRTLTEEYLTFLGENLHFQDLEAEFAELPGMYGPPSGAILIAYVAGKPAGSIAVRPLKTLLGDSDTQSEAACEAKRLYVRPEHRGLRIGLALVTELLSIAAAELRYREVYLDTLPRLSAANALYKQLGFQKCDAYYYNPLPGVLFQRKVLVKEREGREMG